MMTEQKHILIVDDEESLVLGVRVLAMSGDGASY